MPLRCQREHEVKAPQETSHFPRFMLVGNELQFHIQLGGSSTRFPRSLVTCLPATGSQRPFPNFLLTAVIGGAGTARCNSPSTQSSMMSETPSNLSALDSLHADAFKQGLARLFSTDVAEFTFAEILDGVPTESSYLEFHLAPSPKHREGHPVFGLSHTSFCHGVIRRLRDFRDNFDPLSLRFSPGATLFPSVP